MSCIYTEHASEPIIEIRVLSGVTQNDMDHILPQVEAFIEKHGSIRMVEIVEKMERFDPSVILDGLKFDLKHLSHVSHVAVVTDNGWIGFMTQAASMVMPLTIRVFPMDALDQARDWVQSAGAVSSETST